jgi:hypothetical protein
METKARQGGRRSQVISTSAYVDTQSSARPMRALLFHLNQPEPSPYGRERIAQHAETSMRVIQLGLGAIGHLLARSSVHVEDESIPSECMESLGMLMAELSDMAAICYQLSSEARGAARSESLLQEPRK